MKRIHRLFILCKVAMLFTHYFLCVPPQFQKDNNGSLSIHTSKPAFLGIMNKLQDLGFGEFVERQRAPSTKTEEREEVEENDVSIDIVTNMSSREESLTLDEKIEAKKRLRRAAKRVKNINSITKFKEDSLTLEEKIVAKKKDESFQRGSGRKNRRLGFAKDDSFKAKNLVPRSLNITRDDIHIDGNTSWSELGDVLAFVQDETSKNELININGSTSSSDLGDVSENDEFRSVAKKVKNANLSTKFKQNTPTSDENTASIPSTSCEVDMKKKLRRSTKKVKNIDATTKFEEDSLPKKVDAKKRLRRAGKRVIDAKKKDGSFQRGSGPKDR